MLFLFDSAQYLFIYLQPKPANAVNAFYYLLNFGFFKKENDIFKLHVLVTSAILIGTVLFIVISTIYLYLFLKKKKFEYVTGISNLTETWISEKILQAPILEYKSDSGISKVLNSKKGRQIVINLLISSKKNFTGLVAKNIVTLYELLELPNDSTRKLSSKKWAIKARGIQELYMMEQTSSLPLIFKYTADQNEFVRLEAQIGLINMMGFAGLNFLESSKYLLSDWQQLKLLYQLRMSEKPSNLLEKVPIWLSSSNHSVVIFSLKLCQEYHLEAMRLEVVSCLTHSYFWIRAQAVRTLVSIADRFTPSILESVYYTFNLSLQLYILEELVGISTDKELPFLIHLLDSEENQVQLRASIVIASINASGLGIIEERAKIQQEPFKRIVKHIKSLQ